MDLPQRETYLRAALRSVADGYDLIFIDCPPSLGLLTVNALTAADGVLIPIQCEFLALEGLLQLVQTVDRVKRTLNPTLDVTGVIMTMYDARTRLAPQVVAEVRRFFPTRIFRSLVPRTVRLDRIAPDSVHLVTLPSEAAPPRAALTGFPCEVEVFAGMQAREVACARAEGDERLTPRSLDTQRLRHPGASET